MQVRQLPELDQLELLEAMHTPPLPLLKPDLGPGTISSDMLQCATCQANQAKQHDSSNSSSSSSGRSASAEQASAARHSAKEDALQGAVGDIAAFGRLLIQVYRRQMFYRSAADLQ